MGRTILVVDGSAAVQGIIGRTLMENGFRTVEATNAAQAIRSLETEIPHLVLLEMTTRATDFLDAVRSNPDRTHLPVIVLADEKTVVHARQLQSSGVIVKDGHLADHLIDIIGPLFAVRETVEDAPRSMLF